MEQALNVKLIRKTLLLVPAAFSLVVILLLSTGKPFSTAARIIYPVENRTFVYAGAGTLEGTIYDSNTGLGIPNAFIDVDSGTDKYHIWSSMDGSYSLEVLEGSYAVLFNAFGYITQTVNPVTVANGSVVQLNIHLDAGQPVLSENEVKIHLPPDDSGEFTLTISNTGTGDVYYRISDIPPDGIYPTTGEEISMDLKVDPQVYVDLQASPHSFMRFIVYFTEQADLSRAFRIQDRQTRGRFVFSTLQSTAHRSQAQIREDLDREKIPYQSRYIVNALIVNGNLQLVNKIASHTEVAYIGPDSMVEAPRPVDMTSIDVFPQDIAWNILKVNAPAVWGKFGVTGEGIVVSNIDTGVLYTHPALMNQYRGNQGGSFNHSYNWWDPYGDQPLEPGDFHSHGTHTMGTMVGGVDDEGIGMAPDGEWIACKGFTHGGVGYSAELLECAEFILAPWDLSGENPNPDLRPDIVNNSWGGGQANWWYSQAIYAWRAAGIFPVFANGNNEPGCETAFTPGDSPNVMSVGATNSSDTIAEFSNRGPARISGVTKPDVSAPGVNVYSALNNGHYGWMSGTSMAAPHVAGQAALIWSAIPELRGSVQLTYWIIEQSTKQIEDSQCGNPAPPNNVYGWGRIDAHSAVDFALSAPWQTSWLTVEPNSGTIKPQESTQVTLNFNINGLTADNCYTTGLIVEFSDPYIIETTLQVEVCVGIQTPSRIYLPLINRSMTP
jgi:hypothetical protein